MAEIRVALLAVLLRVKLKAVKLHLEGDLQVIINALSNWVLNAWHLTNFARIIHDKILSFEDFKFFHIKQEGNRETDVVSKWVVSMDQVEGIYFEDCDDWAEMM